MERTFKHLTKADRIRIEALIKAGVKIKEIADMLHVHRSTIYRELKRGRFTALNSDLTTEERYSPDIAHDKYEENLKSKGGSLKIGNDIRLANYNDSAQKTPAVRKNVRGMNAPITNNATIIPTGFSSGIVGFSWPDVLQNAVIRCIALLFQEKHFR